MPPLVVPPPAPIPPAPVVAPMPPPPPVPAEPALPPVAAGASGELVAAPSLPAAAAPPSTAGAEHTHAPNVPADMHVQAPNWPVGHGHSRPGTHLAPWLPLLQLPRNATERHENTMHSLATMWTMVAPFGLRRKRFRADGLGRMSLPRGTGGLRVEPQPTMRPMLAIVARSPTRDRELPDNDASQVVRVADRAVGEVEDHELDGLFLVQQLVIQAAARAGGGLGVVVRAV